jgi:predicted ATPase/DNA-binding XRE family transcriptional regulator
LSHDRGANRNRDTVGQRRSETPSGFALLLRTFRVRVGLSQEGLAERAGISAKAIAALEQGVRRAPYRHTVDQLSEALALTQADRALLEQSASSARGRSASAKSSPAPDNLPQSLSPFLHRPEVAEVAQLLDRHRLVSITGSGGVGKTRTAIEAVRRHAANMGAAMAFADLSSLRDPQLIGGQIAHALRLEIPENGDLFAALGTAGLGNVTLLLDNCEHLIDEAARIVSKRLPMCPSLTVLATSRELLGLSNEVAFRLPPMGLPSKPVATLDEAASYPAVALFLQRARYADASLAFGLSDIPIVIDICRRVDCIPLAIELAAACLRTVALRSLQARLSDWLLISGPRDLPDRQRTTEATISWSFELLDDVEKALLGRVSTFAGGFTLEAAEFVCAGDLLALDKVLSVLTRLVNKSLVSINLSQARTRFVLLETIRAFGVQRLRDRGDFDRFSRQHAEWYSRGPENPKIEGTERRVSPAVEINNVRAAVDWCLSTMSGAEARLGADVLIAHASSFVDASAVMEYRRRVQQIIERLEGDEQQHGLIAKLWKCWFDTYWHHTRELIDQVSPFYERAGDFAAIAVANAQLAISQTRAGDFVEAHSSYSKAAAYFDMTAEGRNHKSYSFFASVGAWILFSEGALAEARDVLRKAARFDASLAADKKADRIQLLAEVEFALDNIPSAIALATEALELYEIHKSPGRGSTLGNLSCYSLHHGDIEAAERHARHALRIFANSKWDDSEWDMTISLLHLATAFAVRGRANPAAVILGFVDAQKVALGFQLPRTDARSYEQLIEALTLHIPSNELSRLRERGSTMHLDAALEFVELLEDDASTLAVND